MRTYLRVGRLDYGECFGQYPVSLEGSDSGSARVSGNLSFGQGFLAVAPCNSDVVTANISKHQLTSPRIGKEVGADFLCLRCSPNAVGDNTWAYFLSCFSGCCLFFLFFCCICCCICICICICCCCCRCCRFCPQVGNKRIDDIYTMSQ